MVLCSRPDENQIGSPSFWEALRMPSIRGPTPIGRAPRLLPLARRPFYSAVVLHHVRSNRSRLRPYR